MSNERSPESRSSGSGDDEQATIDGPCLKSFRFPIILAASIANFVNKNELCRPFDMFPIMVPLVPETVVGRGGTIETPDLHWIGITPMVAIGTIDEHVDAYRELLESALAGFTAQGLTENGNTLVEETNRLMSKQGISSSVLLDKIDPDLVDLSDAMQHYLRIIGCIQSDDPE